MSEVCEPNPEEQIRKLKLQVIQLKNIIKKLTGQETSNATNGDPVNKKKKKGRNFDFNLYTRRHVLFRIAYFGWDYHGYAVQETSGKTIESELFRALNLTRLIESRETSNYHRCGRTDKGVSAFHQVISIDVRSNLLEGEGVFYPDNCRARERASNCETEIEYCKMLNSNLPDHIQVISWAPCANRDFSARFDCSSRTYKYFFPLADLNLELLNEAGAKLCGTHDFRNFCKLDVANGVTMYTRYIECARAEKLDPNASSSDPYTICTLTVKGKAFLWHQIRCIVTILFLVASGKEKPAVITDLLDIKKNPCRPQYGMASELPLNLFFCDYENVNWNYEPESVDFVMKQFQKLWTEHQVKATMLKTALDSLQKESGLSTETEGGYLLERVMTRNKVKTYVPLLELNKCLSLEDKLEKGNKRQKMDDEEDLE